ncbi:hypothetical protein IW138_004188 [Coemansia sp. RSA 986]|nr:hypothetical protein IW138_004188 [Coemansia sp. RSA 986]
MADAYSKLANVYRRISKSSEAVRPAEKRHSLRDPNRPKRPLTSYLLFANENRNAILGMFPDIPPKEIPMKIGQAWKNLPESQRRKYVDKALLLKEDYDVEVNKYRTHQKNKTAAVSSDEVNEHTNTNGASPVASLDEHVADGIDTGSDLESMSNQQTKKPKKKQRTEESAEKKKKKRSSKSKENGSGGADEALKKKKKTNVFIQIALELGVTDLATLSLTNRRLNRFVMGNSDLWLEKISADFGDRDSIVDFLLDAGIDISELAETSSELVPWKNHQSCDQKDPKGEVNIDRRLCAWNNSTIAEAIDPALVLDAKSLYGMHCYRERFTRVFPPSKDDSMQYAKKAESTIDQVKSMLRDGQDASIEVFSEVAYRLMLVQEYFPASVECYYLWALICFMHNAFKSSLAFLDIGCNIDDSFEPIQELAKKVRLISSGVYGVNGDAPLLDPSGTGPSTQLSKALAIIFQQLDSDRDGVLSVSEIANMVQITNGKPAPRSTITQIISAFGGSIQAKSGRRVSGWDINSLTNFYINQSLDDPSETRADLAKFGFDPSTLSRR